MWIVVAKFFSIIFLATTGSSDAACPENWFDCDNGKCIAAVWHCDGDNDCGNLKDEHGCDNVTQECAGFVCRDHHCIPTKWQCDGHKDCTDGSDEELCSPSKLCTESEFRCSSGSCINQSLVCDKKKDCIDGSDEGLHCDDPCENAVCSQNCGSTPAGPRCYCNDGYILDAKDNKTCLDINECLEDGFCSHQCANTNGSYECSCQSGYELVNRACKARGEDPILVFTTLQEVRGMYLKSKRYFLVRRAINRASAVDMDLTSQHIYWIEISNRSSVYSAKLDGSSFRTILSHGLLVPEDIAVDYVAKNLYLTDSRLQQILVCKMDGTMCSVLHDENVGKPRSIVLDPAEGFMYWSDWGEQTSGIYRSGMDGSSLIPLVSNSIGWPNGMAIDHSTSRLYWADAKLSTIEYISLDGSSRKILNATVFHPYSLAVFEDTIFWTDWSTFSLESCNKFTGHQMTLLPRENSRLLMGIRVYHPVLTATVSNPCWSSNCSHMCLISPVSGFSCACPHEFQLESDGKTCTSNRCSGSDFQCKNGRCILKSWRCDRRNDCLDNSDEEDCPTVATCTKDQVSCLNGGECIAMLWRCDGEQDCADGTDEVNCNTTLCSSGFYRCDSGQCIPVSWVCDGSKDCQDISDEKNCKSHSICKENMYRCQDGSCIYNYEVCDGHNDCSNWEDEFNCTQTMCHPEEVLCPSSKRCILRRWICDGDSDCRDGSDEENCEESKIQQPKQTSRTLDSACDDFYCYETGQCLPWSKVCDGHQDCKDLPDEGGLCSTACSDDNGGCSHICRKAPFGSRCLCHKGHRLLPDNKTCDDIDECLISGTCSHYCNNTRGGFKCSCAEGYVLHNDRRLCKADGPPATLVYLLGDKMRGFNLHSHNQHVIVDVKDADMTGMDYDISQQVFFWTERNDGHIKIYSPDTRKGDVVILPSLRPISIRYDWIAKNFYLMDDSSDINVCSKDGRFCKTLIKPDRILIDSMDISPTTGFMFWTAWADTQRQQYSGLIERAEMDGSHRLVIVSDKTISPTAITVDHVLHMLYWTDKRLNSLECADFHGFKRRQIIQSHHLFHPLAVAVFEDNVYLADWGSDSIKRCNKFIGRQDCDKITKDYVKPHVLRIVHKTMQPQGINRCLNSNCSHLCLLTRTSGVCACEEGDGACRLESPPVSPVENVH